MNLTKLVEVTAGKLQAIIDGFGGRWGSASRCKRVLRRLQARLAYLKSMRITIVKDLRPKVAIFVQNGDVDSALFTAEQIVEDENMIQLHGLLHESCQIVINNLPYIRGHIDCPTEVHKAISTLVFSATRCTDLPELHTIRRLFAERYGDLFDKAAAATQEGSHGRFFNLGVKERLALRRTVSDDMKVMKVGEIVGEDCSSMRRSRKAGSSSGKSSSRGSRRSVSGAVDVACGRSYRSEDEDGSSIEKVWESIRKVGSPERTKVGTIPKASSMLQLGGWCRSDKDLETMKRTASLPSMLPSHVHPKLPDCDDLEEKFKALKVEHMRAKRSVARQPILYRL